MREACKKRLEKLNEETNEILLSFVGMEASILQKKGSGWSIIQVLNHLESSESGTLLYMKKKGQAGKGMKKINLFHKMRAWLSNRLQTTSLKWKVPSFMAEPPNDHSLEEIKERWDKTRKDVTEYVNQYPEELMNRLVFKHPLSGRLTLKGAIDSLIYHQRHHIHQLKRIKKEFNI